jgi:hypothetical protein
MLALHQNSTSQLANQMMESIDIQLNHIALKEQINADISAEAAQLQAAIDDLDDVLNAKQRLTEFDAEDNRLAVVTLRHLKTALLVITICVAIILLFFVLSTSFIESAPSSSSSSLRHAFMDRMGRFFRRS